MTAETNEYDAIFKALKHPVRRQILLLLEEKGEASFTDIQNSVHINDTGLISYHLGELAPLVEQTERGKYRLSEVGHTSITLFRKVELEKQRTNTGVRKELGKTVGEIIFLFLILGVTLMVPLSIDIYVSVQNVYAPTLSSGEVVGLYLVGLSGMIIGAILFTFYDWHFFKKNMKTNVVHSTIFALSILLLIIPSAYVNYIFKEASWSNKSSITLLLVFSYAVSLLVSAPLVSYGMGKLTEKR